MSWFCFPFTLCSESLAASSKKFGKNWCNCARVRAGCSGSLVAVKTTKMYSSFYERPSSSIRSVHDLTLLIFLAANKANRLRDKRRLAT